MQPRLKKYKQFIEKEYTNSLTWNKGYSLAGLNADLKQKIKSKQFKKIVFCGMGCSAIVADMIKGFFINQKIAIQIEVVNGYDIDYLIDKAVIKDDKTLVIIKSYSGCSQEPIRFFKKINKLTDNIIFLTSGGELEKIAAKNNISIIHSKLKNHIKEFDLLHAPQHFAILLNIFFELGLLKSNYQPELLKARQYIKKEFTQEKIQSAKQIAKRLRHRQIVLLAAPQWHLTLLKLLAMHFNEMAVAPAHANLFHEFTHCEVTMFSHPQTKLAVIVFQDIQEDEYTKNKMENLVSTLTQKVKQNKNIQVITVNLVEDSFLKKFFSALLLMQYITYFLAVYYNIKSRQLISKTSANPWYAVSE